MHQKKWTLIGLAGLLLGGLISLTPFQLAPVCTKLLQLSTGAMTHMKCHYTGQAEVVLGFLVMASSLLLLLVKREETKKALAVMLAILGVAILIIPTNLGIGICAKPEMDCHTTAKFLYAWAGGLMILGAASLFLRTEQVQVKDQAMTSGGK